MKPIKLKLRGFLTYKEDIEIDFTKLYDKKIFLISGDTGSGKTSIFDAINFALYGSISRQVPIDRLRSDFLNGKDPFTYVNLIFQASGKSYEIERIPSQIARKSKDFQDIKHSVSLYELGDEKRLISEKIKETEEKIIEIIGLDQSQFSKVMLLAQGDFQQFLNAKSDERSKLLGDIFKTQAYKEIQENIKEKASQAIKAMEEIDNRLENSVFRYEDLAKTIDRDDILTHDFDKILISINAYENSFKESLKNLSREEINIRDLQKEKIREKNEGENLNKNIDLYNQSKKNHDNLLALKEEKDKLKESLKLARSANNVSVYEGIYQKVAADLKKSTYELENLEKEEEKALIEANDIDKKYSKLESLKDKENKLRLEESNEEKTLQELKSHLKIKEKYLSFEEKIKNLGKLEEERKRLVDDLEEKKAKLERVQKIDHEIKNEKIDIEKELFMAEKDLEKNAEKYKIFDKNKKLEEKIKENFKKVTKLEEQKEELLKAKEKYDKNIRNKEINELIDKLNNSKICPICGTRHDKEFDKYEIEDLDIKNVDDELISTNANIRSIGEENSLYQSLIVEVLSQEDLEKEKELVEKNIAAKKNQLQILADNLKENAQKLKELSINISKMIDQKANIDKNLEDLYEKSKAFEDIKIKYLANKEKFQDMDQASIENSLKIIRNDIDQLSKAIKEISESYNQSQKYLTKLKADIANTNNHISDLREKQANSLEDFRMKIQEYFSDEKSYKNALASYEQLKDKEESLEEYYRNLEKARAIFENYLAFKDKDKVNLEEIDSEISTIDEKLNGIRDEKSKISIKIHNASEIYGELEKIKEEFQATKEESETLSKLAKIAEGSFAKVKGREKIDFESFVLTYYFDKVLAFANIRLQAMSDGQFSMARKSVGLDQRSKQGLDIEILDANTGKKRPAATLSGGESFLASLSLALGLSDEISAENGGIEIKTLFIDEGFGTLSEDYLNNVISQIEKLSYENKFIGLISHVGELKEAIDAKILVTYEEDKGSFIKVVSWLELLFLNQ